MRFYHFRQLLVNFLIRFPHNRVLDRLVVPALVNTIKRFDQQVMKTKFGYSIYVGGDTSLSGIRASVIRGEYEAGYMRLLISLIKSGETAIDIGANEGYIALFLAMKVLPNGYVFAIEPHPTNVRMLKENISLNELTNLSVISKAASDKAGRFQMYGDRAWGSLHKQRNLAEKAISVEVDTLDNIFNDHEKLGKLTLIKIDAEGNEIRAIRGARNLITKFRPVVAFEINLTLLAYEEISINEVFDFFLDSDYSLFIEREGKLVPLEWLNERILNCIAMPRERL